MEIVVSLEITLTVPLIKITLKMLYKRDYQQYLLFDPHILPLTDLNKQIGLSNMFKGETVKTISRVN